MKRFLGAFIAATLYAATAYGQSAGTVTNHAFALGKGPGVQGYTSLLCNSAQLAVGQAAADPICRTVSGDWTLNAAGVATLATVNANVGSFGSATQCVSVTVNAKGLITAASQTACTTGAGGAPGQVQFNSAGVLGGFTVGGDATLNTGTGALTLATVNTNTGTWGSATLCPAFTVNGKGLITAAANSACTPSIGNVTGLGTGVGAALGVNVGSAGAFVTFNGAGGTPSSMVGTNITGTAAGLTAGGLTGPRTTLPTIQRFTSGSGTYTTPANVLWIEIELVGGGGGGGAQSTNNGVVGGNTCWNTTGAACTAPVLQGSGGGAGPTGSVGALGGAATGGNVYNVTGGDGSAFFLLGASQAIGGQGGNSCRGGGARSTATTGGNAAANTGAGGSGAGSASTSVSGAGGGAGGCVKHIINSPAASYTYAVGAGGAGGAAGVNAGGNGGSGEIDVIEHYN